MNGRSNSPIGALRTAWLLLVLAFLYVPMVSVVLASLSNTRYMRFPHRVWTTEAYADALGSYTTGTLHLTSFKVALAVVLVSVVLVT